MLYSSTIDIHINFLVFIQVSEYCVLPARDYELSELKLSHVLLKLKIKKYYF